MQLREGLAQWAQTPFESQAHMIAAMRDPQYSRIPEYRAAVEAKIALNNSGIAPRVYDQRQEYVAGGIGQTHTEAGRSQIEAGKLAEQELAERYGYQAVAPANRNPV